MNKQCQSPIYKQKLPFLKKIPHTQVSLVLMGGLQSEASVVMVADPCSLCINKLTMFMNDCGGSSWQAPLLQP